MLTLKLTLFLVTSVVLVAAVERKYPHRECYCTLDINPVCGSDGQTYINPCRLICARRETPELNLGAACTGKCPCDDIDNRGMTLG
ncbi:PREDICTED: serine protease inhibitor dipetalogastin-like [Priapulus caudatus]|uniref:Serine protease inhibitor dipetalogastin-like n=1 Tax=Priapulus caudatus TaxID=37621 RepID=A0ABM1DU44_PRICU|nr:PREDICTED: serine protease inhibitor dipetalogastin-like [Priapulus caudatus]